MKLPFFKKEKEPIEELEFKPEKILIGDIIAPPSVEISQNYLKLGERFCRTFFIFWDYGSFIA